MDNNYLVTKANLLINSRYDLSVNEQRLILMLASLVQPTDEDFKEYDIRVEDFIKLLDLEGKNSYTALPKITKELMSKVLEIKTNEFILQMNWLSSCKYMIGTGRVIMKFSPDLKPYLLQLKEYFTTYKLENILKMRSKYSIRLYEILKSHAFKKRCTLTIDELRFMLKAESYTINYNFRTRILDPAIAEINQYTDLFVTDNPIKEGKKYTKIEFTIESSAAMEAKLYRSYDQQADDSDLKYYEKK